ncbi:protein of unknown function [Hyphomicrobium sp. MC1]|nr:protein of unknown function [Hyphomicrobium sp. MC1]
MGAFSRGRKIAWSLKPAPSLTAYSGPNSMIGNIHIYASVALAGLESVISPCILILPAWLVLSALGCHSLRQPSVINRRHSREERCRHRNWNVRRRTLPIG